jgi:hypothetical protein
VKLHGPSWRRQSARDGRDWAEGADDATTVALLEDYASSALSPDAGTVETMRSSLVSAFRQVQAEQAAATTKREVWSPRRRVRVLAAAASLAVLMISGTGLAAAESGPGEPFYRTRLAIEAMFLPPAGSGARLQADLDRAQARLDDAQSAAAADNWNAEADAVGAYGEVVGSISQAQVAAAGEQTRLRLARQLATLRHLESGAGNGVGRQLGKAIDSIDTLLAGSPGQPDATVAPTDGGTGGGSSGNGATGSQAPGVSPATGGGGGPGPSASPQPSGQGQQGGNGGPGSTSAPGGSGRSGSRSGG